MLITKRDWKMIVFVNENGEMTSRVCTKCGELKVANCFGSNGNRKRPDCVDCHNETSRKTVSLRLHKHRAKKHGLPSTITLELREKAKAEQGYKCILSGSPDIVTEHITPLSWETGFGDTYGNVVFMTHELNVSKRDKNIFEWIKTQPKEYQERFYNVLVPMMAERNGMTSKEYEEFVNRSYENRRKNNE